MKDMDFCMKEIGRSLRLESGFKIDVKSLYRNIS